METQHIQLTAGRGPAECAWVVAQVLCVFLAEGRAQGYRCTVVGREPGLQAGTLLSAMIRVEGDKLSSWLHSWKGTLQWIGKSPYRPMHKRKNWFIALEGVTFNKAADVVETDIAFQAVRAGGPGGQHVNKVSSAVRATHRPTGITVLVSESRSQHHNKRVARERLIQRVGQRHEAAFVEAMDRAWNQHNQLKRGNPIRVFTGAEFATQKQFKN